MDIPALFTEGSDNQAVDTASANYTQGSEQGQSGQTTNMSMNNLNGQGYIDDNPMEELVRNDTINTNDNSAVGDFKAVMPDPPVSDPIETTTNSDANDQQPASADGLTVTDPTEMDFIKTYTKEFDLTIERAMTAVRQILEAIDKTVSDHSDDIEIPDVASEFLEKKPNNGKVQKFADAQQIVRTIMQKAVQAKEQSEAAAKEAAKIYADIQDFKRDTEEQIESIKSRDEFGQIRPTDKPGPQINTDGVNLSFPA